MGSLLYSLSFILPLTFFTCAEAALRTYNLTIHPDYTNPDGFWRQTYLVNGQQPGPLIECEEGDDLEILVQNNLPVDSTIHFHGLFQKGTPYMDGVPGVTQYPILSGGNFTYAFNVGDQYGFYWYHSHIRAYYADAVRGPIYIKPSANRTRPFAQIDQSSVAEMMDAEENAFNLLVSDWMHDTADTIYAMHVKSGIFPSCADSIVVNGMGRVVCQPQYILDQGITLGHGPSVGFGPPPGASGPVNVTLGPRGCFGGPPPPSSNGTNSTGGPPGGFNDGGKLNPNAFNPEVCYNTTSPYYSINTTAGAEWVAINFVNGGSANGLTISIDGHFMWVYAADGSYINPQKVQVITLPLGERLSVMVKLDQQPGRYAMRYGIDATGAPPQLIQGISYLDYANSTLPIVSDQGTYLLMNGSAKACAVQLIPDSMAPFGMPSPPASNQTVFMDIMQTSSIGWVMTGSAYSGSTVPVLFGNTSTNYNQNFTIHIPYGNVVDVVLNNTSGLSHPMHLHGHKYWVLGKGDGNFNYASTADAPAGLLNTVNPPYKDTELLLGSGWMVLRFVADNPGAWIFHCHIIWHLMTGFAAIILEGEQEMPTVPQYLLEAPTFGTSKSSNEDA